MSIWRHQDTEASIDLNILRSELCIFCNSSMIKSSKKKSIHIKEVYDYIQIMDINIRACPICGWWTVINYRDIPEKFYKCPYILEYYGSIAVLKKLDLNDISLPINDVSQYLLAKYEDRFQIHPRLFEETVASVFRNAGYHARTTAYQNDGGIDVVLDGKDNKIIGVQVKRYKNSIRVSQIREFAGALIENNMTKGIFVTTSKFQSGAHKSIYNFEKRGIGVKLMDSDRFYDALQIKRETENLQDEIIEYISNAELKLIYSSKNDSMVERMGDIVISKEFNK
ncbi:MAG: restriction endonuclease [Lachnospiraceae bacterium]|nr:restriction endonuclease [Lachnospiraceae bacterium]